MNRDIQTAKNGCRGIAGPGRPKGSKNRVTGILKEAILIAGEQAGGKYGNNGLVSYLEEQAVRNPAAFMSLLGKVLPLQVAAADAHRDMVIEVTIGGDELIDEPTRD